MYPSIRSPIFWLVGGSMIFLMDAAVVTLGQIRHINGNVATWLVRSGLSAPMTWCEAHFTSGYIAGVCCLVVAAVAWLRIELVVQRRIAAHCCPNCGYPQLKNAPASSQHPRVCSECGTAVPF